MPHFFFKALDVADKVIQGQLDAPSEALAQERLKRIYKKTLVLREEGPVIASPKANRRLQVKIEALTVYTRQLATMISSGISINRALRFLTQGENESMNLISARLGESVEGGNSLSVAMAEQPRCFSDIYLALVRAGEKSGALDTALLKLADLLEKVVKMKKRLVATFAYPCVIGLVCLANAWLFVFYIIPIMLPLFTSIGVKLPWPTVVVLTVNDVIHSPIFLGATVALFLAGGYVGAVMMKKNWFRYWVELHMLKIPVIGNLLRLSSSARVLYTMATLLDAGVTLAETLVTLAEVAGNVVMAKKLTWARASMLEGSTVYRSFQAHDVFPDTALQMLKVGEETGRLGDMVRRVGQMFEEDVDIQLDRFASLIEPMIMAVMGTLVAFIVLAAFLPIISLIQQF